MTIPSVRPYAAVVVDRRWWGDTQRDALACAYRKNAIECVADALNEAIAAIESPTERMDLLDRMIAAEKRSV